MFLVFVDNSSTIIFAHYVIVGVYHVLGAHHVVPPFMWLVLPYPYIVLQVGISLKEGCWLLMALEKN
jgi:hypothetical protein